MLSGSEDELWIPQTQRVPEPPEEVPNESDEDTEDDDNTSKTPPAVNQNQPRKALWFAEKDNDLNEKVPDFTGHHKSNISGEMPIDYFYKMLPDDFLEFIVEESNLYATKKGKDNFCLTVPELKVFLGINFVTTYLRYSRLQHYWTSKHGTRLSIVADHMTRNRFSEIRKYLHFVSDDKPNNNNDKLYKIRPVLNHFSKVFREAYEPEEHLSLDEMIIPFKGRAKIKQYIRGKPHPWGIKTWVLAGISGYVYVFEIYEGANQEQDNSYASEFGAVGGMVLRLCQNIKSKNHKLFFDNLFTSIPLLQKLYEWKIFATGTIRANRLKEASSKLKPINIIKKEPRGSFSVTTNTDNITITRWFDNSAVHVASSFLGASPVGTAKRWSRKEKGIIEIPRPASIEMYNKNMGGVDLMDSLLGLYQHTLRHKRWYFRIFHHILNVAVVNCWLLWKMDPGNEKLDLLEFKSSVSTSLIYQGSSATGKKRGRPSFSEPAAKKRVKIQAAVELRKDGSNHYPAKTEKNMRLNAIYMVA